MSFGAVIASDGEVLDSAISDRLVEVRVEQTLARPTVFALRFQDDVCQGEPDILDAEALAPEQLITVAAPLDEQLVCLVNGPIERQQASFGLGGPGGWAEVSGRDRRAELDRVSETRPHEGLASGTIRGLLEGTFSDVELDDTAEEFSESGGTLNQHGTDLFFIEQQARRNGMYLWIEYPECSRADSSLVIREKAFFMHSPPRPESSSGGAVGVADIELVADTKVILRLTPKPGTCHTVSRFDLDLDTNRPTQTRDEFLDQDAVEQQPTSESDPDTAIEPRGETLSSVVRTPRIHRTTVAGGKSAIRVRAQATLAEAGWFVQATASTTAQMLGGILAPHKVVMVEGAGRRHSGAYQVKAVTHVINGTGHFMDLQLRRNALGSTS